MQPFHRAALTVAAVSALLACTDASSTSNERTPSGEDDPVHGGGDTNPCTGSPRVEALGWADRTELERSPSEAFVGAAGTCTAPFTWDASGLNDRGVVPRTAQSEMSVTVRLDEGSARIVRPAEGAPAAVCPTYLEVDADVQLKSADGTFEESGRSTLRYARESGLSPFGFDGVLGRQGGKLRVQPGKNEQGTLSYSLDGAGASCAGEIAITFSRQEPGSNTGSGGGTGAVGRWSRSGCPLGEQSVDLAQSRGEDLSFAEQLVETWGDASYNGKWDDGKATTLSVQLSLKATSACGTKGDLNIPVLVRYGTADGRIVEHETEANVHVSTDDQLGLWISEVMICKDTRDVLAYTRARCSELESVELQLGLNYYTGRGVEVAHGGVTVYPTARDGAPEPELSTLTLSNP